MEHGPLKKKAIQTPGGAIEDGVSSSENRGGEQSGDQVGQAADSHVTHGDNVRRSGGAPRVTVVVLVKCVENLVVRRNDDSNGQGAPDEEDKNAGNQGLEGRFDIRAGVLHLTRYDT